jgi:hypothetical protein
VNGVLKKDGNLAAQGHRVQLPKVHSIDQNSPRIGIVKAAKQLDESALPCPVVTHQGYHLAFGNLHLESIQRR